MLSIEGLSKKFPCHDQNGNREVEALRDFSLKLSDGEFLVLFGPNACGKSTVLNVVAGLVTQDQGTVSLDGKPMDNVRVGYVFQQYHDSLFPWRNNIDNIAFPLELIGVPKQKRREQTRMFLNEFNIQIDERSYPYQLSGGQQRMLAILRALIGKPDVLLMDEPFTIGSEMILGAKYGLGKRVLDSSMVYNMSEMYAAIVVVGLMGYASNKLFVLLEERVIHWRGK